MDTNYFIFKDGRKVHSSVFHELAKDLPIFYLPITEDIITSKLYWKKDTVWDMIVHIKKVENADFSHPIILNSEGLIVDGWHRVVKAVIKEYETIEAVQLTKELEERIKYGNKNEG